MASKSVGQIAGTVIGAAVGFFAGGNVALGASIGGMIGGMIDPPKGPTVVGPRLDDLSFQTSTLGAPLGRAYGTVPILGNVVWLEGDRYREVITSEEQGGKGGGGATYETAHYYATFAVSLLRVPDATKTCALRRLWIGSNLVYDAGSDDIESIIASNSQSSLFTFYSGSDDQLPNTRWQADKGANAVSGFPGRCYIVIYDLDLDPYSRSLAMAQVKAELTCAPAGVDYDFVEYAPQETHDSADQAWVTAVSFSSSVVKYSVLARDSWGGTARAAEFVTSELAVKQERTVVSLAAYPIPIYLMCHATQSDVPVVPLIEAIGYPTITAIKFHWIYETGPIHTENITGIGYVRQVVAIDGFDTYLASADGTSSPVFRLSGTSHVASSVASYDIGALGVSENYVFGVLEPPSGAATTTVYKFDRDTLALVATYTQTAPCPASIQVVSDDVFYTLGADNHVRQWVSGAVVADFGAFLKRTNIPHEQGVPFFAVLSSAPRFGYSFVPGSSFPGGSLYVGHENVPASVANLRDIVTAECGLAGVSAAEIDLTALTDSDVRGYRIANAGSIRSSLEMLQAAYPFDVAPSGYKLRLVSRGGASLATIPEADLGAASGGDALPVLLPLAREMDTQIPYKVSVRYLDPAREYDIGEQYASRPDTASVSERTVELSIVMTGDEAARAADVLNQKDWLERVTFGPFSLPPTWRAIEPPDVVTVEHRGQAHSIRLTRAEFLPDGRIECAGVYSAAQSYTSSATAQESLTLGQSLVPLAGSTAAYLLDIPRIRSEQDVPGMSFGMLGLASGWPGGALLRSDDSGNTWPAVGAMNSRAKVFTTGAALSSHHGYSIDHGAVLTVTPRYSAHELSSVTEDQLYGHANLAAYGADGRWEIVAFRTVTDNTGSYTLKDFLRGLYGSEWASGLHVTGDLLVMMDTATVGFFGLPTNALGASRPYRAVTQGASINSADDVVDVYEAINLKPLSPVDIDGARDVISFDWSINWSRRSRWPVELFSGVAVPLGESSESYEVDLFDSGYSTLKRTFTGLTSPSVIYTNAQQMADFGALQQTVQGKVFPVSSVVGRGFPSEFSLTRIIGVDPYISGVSLGLHMEGANGSTSFIDIKGNTITAAGNAQLTTGGTQFAFGASCGVFDGTGDYLSFSTASALGFGASKFTLDGHLRPAAIGTTQDIVDARGTAAGDKVSSFLLLITAAGKLQFNASTASGGGDGGAWTIQLTGTTTMVAGTAYHAEVSRDDGNVWRLFINGVIEASATNSFTMGAPAATAYIGSGCTGVSTLGYYYNGRLKDWRVTKNFCRHSSAFTPPTSAFSDV